MRRISMVLLTFLLVACSPAAPARGPAPPEAPAPAGAHAEPSGPPRFTCDVRRSDSEPWSGIPDSAVLAPGPVQVRLGAPSGLAGEAAVKRAETLLQGVRHTVTPTTEGLVIDLPQPPARLELPYDTLWKTDTDQVCLIYFGDAPVLAVLDPATGQETVLGPAPVDVYQSVLAPDGRHAALIAWDPRRVLTGEVFLVDTATGVTAPVTDAPLPDPWYGSPLRFTAEALVVPGHEQVAVRLLAGRSTELQQSRARFWGDIAPDGRTLAGFFINEEKQRGYFVSASIVLHDISTGKEQVFPDAAWAHWPPKETPPRLDLTWADDGALLIDSTAKDEPLRRLDPRTGQVTEVGPRAPNAPAPLRTRSNPAGWQMTSQGWEPIRLTDPTGREQTRGEGWPVGWRADGKLLLIRWPGAGARRPGLQLA